MKNRITKKIRIPRVKIRILSFSCENPKKIRIFGAESKIRLSTTECGGGDMLLLLPALKLPPG
jgi:hypothetical protein